MRTDMFLVVRNGSGQEMFLISRVRRGNLIIQNSIYVNQNIGSSRSILVMQG